MALQVIKTINYLSIRITYINFTITATTTTLRLIRARGVGGWSYISVALRPTPACAASFLVRDWGIV